MKKLIYILVIWLMLAAPSWAADYYVRQGEYLAKDGSNCANSISIATFNSSASGGNTYVICSGETITTTIAPPTGTEGSVITLISEYEYDTTGTQYDVEVTTASYGANLSSKDYITIDGLYFNDCGGRWILMNYSDYNIIQNCKFYDSAAYAGIRMDYCNYNKFIDNEFPNAKAGTSERETDPTDFINWYNSGDYNVFEGNTFGNSGHVNVGLYGNSNNNVFRGNTFQNQYHTGLNSDGPHIQLIEKNLFYDQGEDMANDPDCGSCNMFTNPAFQGGNTQDIIIRKNIFDNNGAGISVGGSGVEISGIRVYNNTVNGGVLPLKGHSVDAYVLTDTIFKNNAFTNAVDSDYPGDSFPLARNLYYRDNSGTGNRFYNNNSFGAGAEYRYRTSTIYNTFAELIAAYGTEFPSGNISSDPKYTDAAGRDFTLQADSDMIDAGIHLTEVAAADTDSGDTLVVDDGSYFYDGWGISGETGDYICIGSNLTPRLITDVTDNTLTVTDADARSENDEIYLAVSSTVCYAGTAPDIGAEERGTGISITGPSSSQDCADDSDPYDTTQEVTMTVDSSTNATCKYDTASTDPCSTATYAGLANTFTDTTAQTTHTTPITSSCDTSIPYSVICIDDATSLPSNCLTVTVTVAPGGDIAGLRIDTGGTVSITTGGTVSIE